MSKNPKTQRIKGILAILKVAETQRDVLNAQYREEFGWIDFRWGNSEKGVCHIIKRAKQRLEKFNDGMTPDKILRRIPGVIAYGKITQVGRSVNLEYNGFRAVIAPNYNGKKTNHWILTGFDLNKIKKKR